MATLKFFIIEIEIKRKEDYGGNKVYSNYDELEKDFANEVFTFICKSNYLISMSFNMK